ncbi:thermonuclease family protein [Streptomyces sp. 147326]|uniref:thermonuclease family protein n=1 Tax=Streptomyces sp. 147326 TaxID=3074379 RepID=UPI0038573E26
MSMLLIKGSFRVDGGAEPDGDTLPFVPDDVADWKLVGGRARVVPKADGRAAVRLEGVDALETHYKKPGYGPERHQPRKFGHQAADALLKHLGFTSIDRHENETVTTVPVQVPGFILTSGADAYGRCIALAFDGTVRPPVYSGYEVSVDEGLLKRSANYRLVEDGLAYPMFYPGLPGYLRDVLKAAAREAREAAPPRGLWAEDKTTDGALISGIESITDDITGTVILPKLFRRLKDYLDSDSGITSLAGFSAYLAGAGDEYRILPDGKTKTGLHRLIEISDDGKTLRMPRRSDELLFLDK